MIVIKLDKRIVVKRSTKFKFNMDSEVVVLL